MYAFSVTFSLFSSSANTFLTDWSYQQNSMLSLSIFCQLQIFHLFNSRFIILSLYVNLYAFCHQEYSFWCDWLLLVHWSGNEISDHLLENQIEEKSLKVIKEEKNKGRRTGDDDKQASCISFLSLLYNSIRLLYKCKKYSPSLHILSSHTISDTQRHTKTLREREWRKGMMTKDLEVFRCIEPLRNLGSLMVVESPPPHFNLKLIRSFDLTLYPSFAKILGMIKILFHLLPTSSTMLR